MRYTHCGHCGRKLTGGPLQRYCCVLCKSAEAKRLRKLRTAEDALYGTSSQTATYVLNDMECLKIEAALAAGENHVFDSRGRTVKDAHSEKGSANQGLHESWADKGAALDVDAVRRTDRFRHGGVWLSGAWWSLSHTVNLGMRLDQLACWQRNDGLTSPYFHRKTFGFEIDDIYAAETTRNGHLRADLR